MSKISTSSQSSPRTRPRRFVAAAAAILCMLPAGAHAGDKLAVHEDLATSKGAVQRDQFLLDGLWFDGQFRTRAWLDQKFSVGPGGRIYGSRTKVDKATLVIVERFGELRSAIGMVQSYTVVSPTRVDRTRKPTSARQVAKQVRVQAERDTRGGYRVERIHRFALGFPAAKTSFTMHETYTRNKGDTLVKTAFESRTDLPFGRFRICDLNGCGDGMAASSASSDVAEKCKDWVAKGKDLSKIQCGANFVVPTGAAGCVLGGGGLGALSLGALAPEGCGGGIAVGGGLGLGLATYFCDPLVNVLYPKSLVESACLEAYKLTGGGQIEPPPPPTDPTDSTPDNSDCGGKSGYEKVFSKNAEGNWCHQYLLKDCGNVIGASPLECDSFTVEGHIEDCTGCL